MTREQTITKFELYMDDTTELSTAEEQSLYQKIVNKVAADRPWEKLKKSHSDTTDGNSYIALPSDFVYLTQNYNYTDSSFESDRPVIFVGADYTPYQVVSWSDRRQYRDSNAHAYIDLPNSRLYFTATPTSGQAIEFDYHYLPADVAEGESSWIPAQFDQIIYHGMCADDFIIQQSEKARSYRDEHLREYQRYLDDMAYWNAQLVQM